MKVKVFFVFVLFHLFSLTGCKLLKNTADRLEALSQCKFELIDIRKKISFTEQTNNLFNYVVTLEIAGINPTIENIKLGQYRFDLYANDKWIGEITSKVPIDLLHNSTTIIEEKIIISPRGAIGVMYKKLFDIPIQYKLTGTFYLNLKGFILPVQVNLLKFVDK